MVGICERVARMFNIGSAQQDVPAVKLPEPVLGQMLIANKSARKLHSTEFAMRFEAHFDMASNTHVVRCHRYESSYNPHGVGGFKMTWREYKKEPPLFAGTAEQTTLKILELEQQTLGGQFGMKPLYKRDTLIGGYEGNIPFIRRQQQISAQPA